MLGDLDLIHAAMARDHGVAAGDERGSLRRLSVDSSLSSSVHSVGSPPRSWGTPGLLMRQASLPAASASAPVNIPGAARAARASDGGGPVLRRNSLQLAPFGPFSAGASAVAVSAGALEPAALAGAAAGAGGTAAAHDAARLPMLVRSLSKGLSQSLDFR